VVPVSAIGLGISHGFTTFSNKNITTVIFFNLNLNILLRYF